MENRRPPDHEIRHFAVAVLVVLWATGALVGVWLIRPVLQFTGSWPF
jgi:hypothetical protein